MRDFVSMALVVVFINLVMWKAIDYIIIGRIGDLDDNV